jgi:hypothetical protein
MVKGDGQELLLLLVRTPLACHLYGWSPDPYQPRHLNLAARFLLAHGVTECRTAVPSGSSWEQPGPGISVETQETYSIWQLRLT